MRFVKAILIILAGLGLIAALVWTFWLREQVAFARVASAYGAKQVCSCMHIGARSLESCKTDFTADVSALTFTDDGTTTRVTVLGGLIKSEARFEPGFGCTLIKD